MSLSIEKNSLDLSSLASMLLTTLDESIFFSELAKYFKESFQAEDVLVYKVLHEQDAQLLVGNSTVSVVKRGTGVAGHVIRTRRAYFSNNVLKDPIYAGTVSTDVKSELCVPVAYEGVVLATLHLQFKSPNQTFNKDDTDRALSILASLKAPIVNMKMYLSAKALNELLLKKIEKKEKELAEKENGLEIADSFKICDKDLAAGSSYTKKLLDFANKAAVQDINILLEGEEGTGKETIAKRIHCRSKRARKAFIVVDCSAFTPEQLEIELFGSERNSVSNNNEIKIGLLEFAHGGTLLIKNITHLSFSLQSRLLQFLKDGFVFRVGSQVPYRTDVRIITTTSTPLLDEIENGKFRADLSYLLDVVNLKVLSLKERLDDIEPLVNTFLASIQTGEFRKSISPGAVKALLGYSWPGNVQELKNVIERTAILCDGMIITKDHLPTVITSYNCDESVVLENIELDFTGMSLNELEKHHICTTLDHLNGNKTKSAKSLGITIKTLYNKLHSYGMVVNKGA